MSDQIKHECGIVLLRLLKPLEYYQKKYGTWAYGLQKLYLLMEKQHNRGQDGAGIACVKFDLPAGVEYIKRIRSNKPDALRDIFEEVYQPANNVSPEKYKDWQWAKQNFDFAAEAYLGHLRYGTFGGNGLENVHPVLRANNWMSRNLLLAGNFNLTNVEEMFGILTGLGQHPKGISDTVTILENVGHFLDEENQGLFELYKKRGYTNREISPMIHEKLDITSILQSSSRRWDGGYAIAGILGHGDAFVMRDPAGIRPAYYFHNDEIAVVTSERPVIQTVIGAKYDTISELRPGHALIIKRNGRISEEMIKEPTERRACSFERIYFSRGSDRQIYQERKTLGRLLMPNVITAIDQDLKNSVFSYIPNTAESAFFGLVEGIEDYLVPMKKEWIKSEGARLTDEKLTEILSFRPRIEKVAIKDVKLRTFITQDHGRDNMVEHVYDITYGTVRQGTDNLVVIDDSIVRGTTLRRSILRMLDRLQPRRVVVVSSSPQIRYPDCYGIDMAKLGDFIAFEAAVELLKEHGKENLLLEVYERAKEQILLPKEQVQNEVKRIYEPFGYEQVSEKIAQLLRPEGMKAELKIVYQTIENLHQACPLNLGDWYFTGNYPTPGGNKVANISYINYIEKRNVRAY